MRERPDYLKRLEARRGVRCAVCDDHGCEFCPKVRESNCLACLEGAGRHAIDCPHRDDELAARRQERVDGLEGSRPPVWDEAGAVDVRLACGLAGVVALVLLVWLAWPYLVGAGVTFAGWRVATSHTRRRRPRSSWSSLGRTAAMMYAAWNSRWLKGSTFKASVPAAAGREHAPCGECGRDEAIPF
jgi:hypothetical protein